MHEFKKYKCKCKRLKDDTEALEVLSYITFSKPKLNLQKISLEIKFIRYKRIFFSNHAREQILRLKLHEIKPLR